MFHKDLLDRVGQELVQCFKENPLRVDNKKLYSLKPDTQFTTTQIAWFFRQQRSIEKVRLRGLDQRNLTDHLSSNIHLICNNNSVGLSLDKIPETIWLKDLAHYLAITAKILNDYGDVNYNSSSLVQNAKRIHDLLWKELKAKIKIYWTPFSYMRPEHQKLAEKLGIIQIERYGNNPERDFLDDWSIEVTRELALELLRQLSEFSNLLNCGDRGTQKSTQSNSSENTQPQNIRGQVYL